MISRPSLRQFETYLIHESIDTALIVCSITFLVTYEISELKVVRSSAWCLFRVWYRWKAGLPLLLDVGKTSKCLG
jgi:hypothetical protein